ncbi:Imm42 family immunity protein [Kosakonia oryzendophytica]|uniref:Imm42 family immunity protein n=1 Tax=Kosakonia oryzendophytica TaxID=1005665 RepID=UPI003D325396
MIFCQPYEFAVFYDLLEKTDDGYWKFGVLSSLLKMKYTQRRALIIHWHGHDLSKRQL